MKLPAAALFIVLISLNSCSSPDDKATVVVDTIPSMNSPEQVELNSKALEITYAGTLPCADCSGILTEITFHPDSMGFNISETFKGTPDGDRTYESSGKYQMIKGNTVDATMVIYELNPGKPEQIRHFKQLGESGIKMLDKNMNEIESALNYVLVRK
ncbi:hypothetical protein BH11BAC2_BH11BAC2_25670 [soil metagenome]